MQVIIYIYILFTAVKHIEQQPGSQNIITIKLIKF